MDMMSYLMGRNSGGAKKGAKIEVVTELPETGESNVIYLVPKQDEDENNVFDEYIWINDDWELIGTTDIDLSDYYTKSEVDGKLPPIYTLETIRNIWEDQANINSSNDQNAIARASEIINTMYNSEKKYGGILFYSTGTGVQYLFLLKGAIENNKALFEFYSNTSAYYMNYTDQIFTYRKLTVNGIWNNNVFTCTSISIAMPNWYRFSDYALSSNVLAKNNNNAFTPTGNYNPATKKYVDDNKGQTIQYETMPTASADYVGKIVQYTGTTDSNYTNGYFYVCVGTTENDVTTYSWSNIEVQGGGETIVLVDDGNQYSTASSLNTEANRAQIRKLCELYASGKRPVVCYIGAVRGGGSQSGSTPYYMYYAKYNISYDSSRSKYDIYFETVPAPYYSSTRTINNVGYVVLDQWVFSSACFPNTGTVTFSNKSMVYTFTMDRYNNDPYKFPFSLENFCTKLGLEIYSTSKTYQIGDYIYARDTSLYGPGVKLYKCNTADTTGTWDSSKWTEATFMEYLSDTLVGGALNGSY